MRWQYDITSRFSVKIASLLTKCEIKVMLFIINFEETPIPFPDSRRRYDRKNEKCFEIINVSLKNHQARNGLLYDGKFESKILINQMG